MGPARTHSPSLLHREPFPFTRTSRAVTFAVRPLIYGEGSAPRVRTKKCVHGGPGEKHGAPANRKEQRSRDEEQQEPRMCLLLLANSHHRALSVYLRRWDRGVVLRRRRRRNPAELNNTGLRSSVSTRGSSRKTPRRVGTEPVSGRIPPAILSASGVEALLLPSVPTGSLS